MLNFLPAPLVGIIASLLLALNIFIWCGFLFLFTFLKLILPFQGVRKRLDPVLTAIAENWITGNSTWMALTQRTQWDVQGLDTLDKHGWYLVGSNHQTWADIFVLHIQASVFIGLLKMTKLTGHFERNGNFSVEVITGRKRDTVIQWCNIGGHVMMDGEIFLIGHTYLPLSNDLIIDIPINLSRYVVTIHRLNYVI